MTGGTYLPRKGYQLGWARVIVRIAADGEADLRQGLLRFLSTNQHVSTLTSETGNLARSFLDDPRLLARHLSLLDEADRLTPLGFLLAQLDLFRVESSPFHHPLHLRWILWWATALAEGPFWAVILRTYHADSSKYDWLMRAAEELAANGSNQKLSNLILGYRFSAEVRRGTAVIAYGKPRFGQIDNLGWSAALPRLADWAKQAPVHWNPNEILRAFSVAEGLDVRPPRPERLLKCLQSLPPALTGMLGNEAPESIVQVYAVADALREGLLEDWFGPEYGAVLREAATLGVYRKSGMSSSEPNLAWDPATIGPIRPSPSRPPAPRPPQRSMDPIQVPPPSAEDERARSWLRALAWWCRGPSVADLLMFGHDSWRLVRGTLVHWLDPRQTRRWKDRSGNISPAADKDKHRGNPLSSALIDFSTHLPPGKGAWVVERVAEAHEIKTELLSSAAGALPVEVTGFDSLVSRWLDGKENDWERVERATALWAATLVEQGWWTTEEIAWKLRDIRDGRADEARELLAAMADRPEERTFRVEGRIAVMGDTRDMPEELQIGEMVIEKGAVGDSGPVDTLTFSAMLRARSALLAIRRAKRDAEHAVTTWGEAHCHRLRAVGLTEPPPEVFGEDDRPISSRQPTVPISAGPGFWVSLEWFSPAPWARASHTWEPTQREEFVHSRTLLDATDRILGLWVAMEHTFQDGDQGNSVIEGLARSSVTVLLPALVDDLRVIAPWMDLAPPPGTWTELYAWVKSAKASITCAWTKHRLERLTCVTDATKTRSALVSAVGHAGWIWRALFSIRCRIVHEAWRGDLDDEQMFVRLDRAATVLAAATLNVRGTRTWEDLVVVWAAAVGQKSKDPTWSSFLDDWSIPTTCTSTTS